MEFFNEQIMPILNRLYEHIPPSMHLQIASHIAQAHDYVQDFRLTYAEPYLINPVNTLLASPPDLYSILILFLILVLSLKVLDYARRVITFWIVLVFRLLFWGAIIGGGYYVYKVGWGKSSQDAAWLLGLAEGFIQRLLAESSAVSGKESKSKFKTGGKW